jgi:hypothetical protein
MERSPGPAGSGRHARLERFVRTDLLLLGVVVFLGMTIPVVLGATAGSLEIPRNDDWSYRRIAEEFWRTGRIVYNNVAAPTTLGQLVAVQPLLWLSRGGDVAFTVAGIASSLATPIGVYALARQFLAPARSLLAALSLILFPGYLAYATSFMTDGPALAAQIWALAIGVPALSKRPTDLRMLAVALAIAVFAFSIRQFGLAAVGALGVAAVAREPRRVGSWILVLLAANACVAVQILSASQSGDLVTLRPNIGFATRLPSAAVSAALMALPAAIVGIVTNRRVWHRRDATYGALLGAGLATAIVASWIRLGDFPTALLGNLTTQQGVLDVLDLRGGRPYLFTDGFWTVVNLLGLVALVIVGSSISAALGAYSRRRRARWPDLRDLGTPAGLLTLFVTVSSVGLGLYGTVWILFDRYLWPIVPVLAVLMMIHVRAPDHAEDVDAGSFRGGLEPMTVVPLGVVTLEAMLAFLLMANAFAFDAARWKAGEDLTAAGLPADSIDAGYEWVGAFATTPANMANALPTEPPYRGWWPQFRPCGLVSESPEAPANAVLFGVERYRLYLLGGPLVDLYMYRIEGPDCPPASA